MLDNCLIKHRARRFPGFLMTEGNKLKKQIRAIVIAAFSVIGVYLILNFLSPAETASGQRKLVIKQVAGTDQKEDSPEVFSAGNNLELVLPVAREQVQGIGYHQAYNTKAMSLSSLVGLMPSPTTTAVAQTARSGEMVSFIMAARGRGSPLDSSVDLAIAPGTEVRSLVSGEVLTVSAYKLYGKYDDIRIEIKPDSNSDVKVCIVHVVDPAVSPGQRVEAGKTLLAKVRTLGVNSQINQYLGKPTDHIHIQINPIEAQPVTANAN